MNAPPSLGSPVDHIRRYQEELTGVRHYLHAHPELGYQEVHTSDLVAAKLAGWGIETHRGIAKTGMVGVIKGKTSASGRAVGLRADMDCLPMHETGGVAYKSQNAGCMHACGHDGHTTMLLGVAKYLAETRNFDGTAYLIFQPAEEGGGGGKMMIDEGLFTRFPADEVYGLHNWPGLPPGKIAVRPGPILAAADRFEISINGRGGHGAMPHLAVDPVVVTAQIITALQTIASRNVNAVDAVVVSVCSMQTSQTGAYNVIPDEVKLMGTVRSFRAETRGLAERRLRELVDGIAKAMGASADITYLRGYPATVNAEREACFAAKVGERIFGAENVVTDGEPSMGAEDFAYMLETRPGAYILLGQGGAQTGCLLHNPNYDFNDDVIPLGAGYLAALLEAALPLP